MKNQTVYILTLILLTLLTSCNTMNKTDISNNPLINDFKTPYQVPPFEKIKNKHFEPALLEAMKQHLKEIDDIANNTEEPTFENTIEALNYSGDLLDKVANVFYNLNSSHTNDSLQELEIKISPQFAKHEDDKLLNEKLFSRIKTVYNKKDGLNLSTEQNMLLENIYKEFVRSGANLSTEDKKKLRKVNEELASLKVNFSQNVLKETNNFKLEITNKDDLSGLPESVISAASEQAGEDGKWVFTIDKPSMIPFLQFSDKRELREKIFKAYINKGDNNNEYDNKKNVKDIINLRIQKANLIGFKTFADYALDDRIAKKPENVYNLLDKIMKPALKVAKKEAEELQKLIYKEGTDFKLMPWDWWYYSEKVRAEKYNLDEEMLRPYFKLENVRDGAFEVATKLYGITFKKLNEIPIYQEDVQAFEVIDNDGSHLGILYMDFFPRPSKQGGAWMSAYRKQYRVNGKEFNPVITTNFNFSKPTGNKPALLSYEEVETLFHEFGHALHGLLSDCNYRELSGTDVKRDFVELPSQIMENWANEPEVLKMYAKHYETGETIPEELINKIQNSVLFNQGFISVEYLAACYLDMDWHTLENADNINVIEFENKSMRNANLIPEIVVRYRSTYFSHIFDSDYSAGYYSYIWAEVLDADAFDSFKQKGLFDQETAKSFRENIISKGGTVEPMELYIRFKGKEPSVEPLLKNRGLI